MLRHTNGVTYDRLIGPPLPPPITRQFVAQCKYAPQMILPLLRIDHGTSNKPAHPAATQSMTTLGISEEWRPGAGVGRPVLFIRPYGLYYFTFSLLSYSLFRLFAYECNDSRSRAKFVNECLIRHTVLNNFQLWENGISKFFTACWKLRNAFSCIYNLISTGRTSLIFIL